METDRLFKVFQEHPVVTTDSRDCPEGSVFFALKGASFNGNRFAMNAIEQGCAYAVVDEAAYAVDERFILVDDCLRALQLLAREHRRQFAIPVIGITGTNGKTTTKELVSAVLARKYNVLSTQGNFNNDIGVPKTLLRLDRSHDIAVVEMGASHPGDIRTLVELVEPQYGIITNVGRAHLQGFGSFEGVVSTKGELYDYLRGVKDGSIFIDCGNDHLKGIAHGLRQICYGLEGSGRLYVEGRLGECAPTLTFSWRQDGGEWREVKTHLIGSYNILNMLAAAAVGCHFGVAPEDIDEALAGYRPSNNRSQLETTPFNHLVVDAYNANPTSMEAALRNFGLMRVDHKMVILGDMKALGDVSHEEHRKVVEQLKGMALEEVWLVGEEFGHTDCAYRKFRDVEEVKAAIAASRPDHRYILIKGSNSCHLAQLKDIL